MGVDKVAAVLPLWVRVKTRRLPALKAPLRRRRLPEKAAGTVVGVCIKLLQERWCLRSGLGCSQTYSKGPSVPTGLHQWPSTVGPRRVVVPPFSFLLSVRRRGRFLQLPTGVGRQVRELGVEAVAKRTGLSCKSSSLLELHDAVSWSALLTLLP